MWVCVWPSNRAKNHTVRTRRASARQALHAIIRRLCLPRRAVSTVITMAKRCELCGKGPVVGRNISHAHNVTPRRFEPNLQRVRAQIGGGVRRIRVCTRCLRSNKVVKAA